MESQKAEMETKEGEAGTKTHREIPVAIRRLMDEVRNEEAAPSAYNRGHNRHNRSLGYNRGHNRHNR